MARLGTFVSLCVIGVVVSMEVTTPTPEATTEDTSGRLLSLPVAEKCAKRPVHFTHDGHNYFYSGNETEFKDMKLNWLDARNICREYCMDLVSLESPSEDQMVNEYINKSDLAYIWTSGRLCNFKGCDREDLQPTRINGWFWSGSGVKMAPTDKAPPGWSYQPWSFTGHNSKINGSVLIPQPDNAEFDINQSVEACMGILNNVYDDGIKWHDIACYHTKPFVCEDSEQLLDYARASFPETNIF
ncbi:hypothetical protein TCAL_04358 [Tigriopus californicus]|uniref:C-type lectin domain-containing protein n=1 Tax=Tigriopus californicus TaxID=6832 RepID=A0A553NNF0_TIGCA|nr:uncharacterized protein LOC131879103 isoform X2 [Tigriopus californicus]TRY66917.1 hypothetical protein TCAL_04358 [Tigriopus californicus]|eukprot:TCALIF_04358-PA protein Name:"Protein of unknown function" AED:0.03 eAED:0.03 QI:235/1/1/1/0.66/0.75/4/130/242